ncbi:MAG: ATP-binding protein [Clostridia bacterium]|nr:ATP-binding protein [Clostridia bacterium]
MEREKKMYRKLIRKMEQWERESIQEPLMMTGVRQVGKTWLIREFCEQQYSDWFYANLEEQPSLQAAFEGDLDPRTILRSLSILSGRQLTEHTALFFDEIQVCERAVTSLKYFCEAKENYRVLAAGSLLGVKIHRFESSFPVGKIHLLQMFPLDFEEFLLSCGEELLRDAILDAYQGLTPLPSAIHEKALELCYDYLIVGGMPRAVLDYAGKGKQIMAFNREIHSLLKLAYLADMTKYVKNAYETAKIQQVYLSISGQLAKENPKFRYNQIKSYANRRDYEAPIDWLSASGLIYQVVSLKSPRSPLRGYANESSFRLYYSDVGMLSSIAEVHARDLLPDQDNIYKGALVENYVVQHLARQKEHLYYYKPSESMEIDLILDDGENIIPLEIKAGRHKRSRSLQNYVEAHHPAYAMRVSALNFGTTGIIRSIPLYAVFCLASP